MSSDSLNLQIITHEGKQFEQEVFSFRLFSPDGELGVYPNHTTLVTSVANSSLHYSLSEESDEETAFFVGEGTLKVQNNVATLLTTEIIQPTDIDAEAEQAAVKKYEQAYKEATTHDEQEVNRAKVSESTAKLRVLAK